MRVSVLATLVACALFGFVAVNGANSYVLVETWTGTAAATCSGTPTSSMQATSGTCLTDVGSDGSADGSFYPYCSKDGLHFIRLGYDSVLDCSGAVNQMSREDPVSACHNGRRYTCMDATLGPDSPMEFPSETSNEWAREKAYTSADGTPKSSCDTGDGIKVFDAVRKINNDCLKSLDKPGYQAIRCSADGNFLVALQYSDSSCTKLILAAAQATGCYSGTNYICPLNTSPALPTLPSTGTIDYPKGSNCKYASTDRPLYGFFQPNACFTGSDPTQSTTVACQTIDGVDSLHLNEWMSNGQCSGTPDESANIAVGVCQSTIVPFCSVSDSGSGNIATPNTSEASTLAAPFMVTLLAVVLAFIARA